MSELIKADNEYKEWIAGISTDFRKSQIRASMKINDEMLRFYWKLGKGISSMSEQFGYGMGFYKTVSDDLKSIFPEVKSFSPTNLKYMRYFYEMYPDAVICPQVEDELITDANRPQVEMCIRDRYTTKQVVHQEGTTGHRERNDIVTYENGIEVARELAHQTIMVESLSLIHI